MGDIFQLIVSTNVFNFAVFLLIIIFIARVIDVPTVLDNMRQEIVKKIDESYSVKSLSLEKLSEAVKSEANTQNEVDEINSNAEISSQAIKEHIIEDAKKKVKNIEQNCSELLVIEQKFIEAKLVSKIGQQSVDMAKDMIIEKLKNNNELHYKFLDAGLRDLEELSL